MEATFTMWPLPWFFFSTGHSLLVPLILNPFTGKISTTFHGIFDDWFTCVISVGGDNVFDPSKWHEPFATACNRYIFDENNSVSLTDKWTQHSLEQAHQHQHECNL